MTASAYAATHDALTQLPNEYLFMDRLNQLVATSERGTSLFALLILVADNHDRIREVEGPAFTDQLTLGIAERLQVTLREPDTVTRRRDNAFSILVPQIESREALTNLIIRLRKTLAEPFQVGTDSVHMTFSLGKAIYPYDGAGAEALMQAAENALQSERNIERL